MATATAWVRSLSCKSTAVADEVYSPPAPAPKKHTPCPVKVSSASLPGRENLRSSFRSNEQDRPATEKKKKKKPAGRKPKQQARLSAPPVSSPARPSSAAFLAMTELPEGHPSRRVVELIFASGWGPVHDAPVPEAEVEALFRVRSSARAVARFEDARRAAALARGADARCAADGNETMRFQCRAPDGDGQVICAAVATAGPSSSAVRTFAGSGAAHAGAGGGRGSGRRGMLVCRVIAGRVRRATDPPCDAGELGGYDSVEAGGGELVVLDRRAVLPCFLVVYKVKPALDSSTSRRSSR